MSLYLLFFWTAQTFCFFGLRRIFTALNRLSLAVARRGYSSLQCVGFLLQWLLLEHRLQAQGLQQLQFSGSRARDQFLCHTNLAALQQVESSQIRGQTCIPCISWQFLNQETTREVLSLLIWMLVFANISILKFLPLTAHRKPYLHPGLHLHFCVHCWLLYFHLQPSLLTRSPDIFTPLFPGHWAALLSPHTQCVLNRD